MTDTHSLRDINVPGQMEKDPCGKEFLKTNGINKITGQVSQVFPLCQDPAYVHDV